MLTERDKYYIELLKSDPKFSKEETIEFCKKFNELMYSTMITVCPWLKDKIDKYNETGIWGD